ncbi:exodeoxyribonuclease VII large subunit [Mariniplasma anaerobium]|uniref:Exodeoxyribonuclease 7 large subunit n=1 Tax=Mariniplasma anaerobium TaxID=2735436 RepID=A0A7U9XUQ6_9MOLU|nr:exodeoxyribonuclease VII large subunit [Mariniplasma anaerobium]BCR36225.1 exodeoxyribonuclease 7 large subunit [Mariniplasma anaerobium]
MDQIYLTVSALTKYIKTKLEGDKHLVHILIKGELSNFKRHSRGHFYFTLKDEGASISCIMFSRDTNSVAFDPKEGDHVLVEGRMSVYEPSGSYSIQVRKLTLDGIGELYLKYEKLKKDLETKGYFDVSHKKEIPKYPKKIGVITSPTGAVIEDIKNTVSRRYLLAEIHLYPALVQGPDSSKSIKHQIELANKLNEVDVLIVGRGGGSIEDLWGFNEIETIEAIYQSKIPIITAIGHETDYTISDFVGDLRAPTPSAAAELATPNKSDLLDKIDDYQYQIGKQFQIYLEKLNTSLLYLDQRLDRLSPTSKLEELKKSLERLNSDLGKQFSYILEDKKQKVLYLTDRVKNPIEKINYLKEKQVQLEYLLYQHMNSILISKQNSFASLTKALNALSPLRLMDKGYAMIKRDKQILTTIKDIKLNDEIEIELKDGYIYTEVKRKKEK